MNRLLVTGGTGFIGRALIDLILRARPGVEVVSLSLPSETMPESWQGKVQCVFGDVASEETLNSATTDVDCIIHLASLLGAGSYDDHHRITVGGTKAVLEAAVRTKARVVIASSIAIYGDYVRDHVCDEALGHGPHYGPYSLAKQAQELLTNHYVSTQGLNACIARPANVFGAGSLPWVKVIGDALALGAPILVDEGIGDAGLIHVNDVASGLLAIAEEGRTGEAYNVSAQLQICWQRYFQDLADLYNLPMPASTPFDDLYELARRDERPEDLITPSAYRAIPLATLNLIGSDNRFPNDHLRNDTWWEPQVDYHTAMGEITEALARDH